MSKDGIDRILKHFQESAKPIEEIAELPNRPGVYAIYLRSEQGVLELGLSGVEIDSLLYIGKAMRSWRRRILTEHFSSAATGSSTLRRSLGALLRQYMCLIPHPRRGNGNVNSRCSHFEFGGDELLTSWMQTRLKLGFYICDGKEFDICNVELRLIRRASPPMNIHGNRMNPAGRVVRSARKSCIEQARRELCEMN